MFQGKQTPKTDFPTSKLVILSSYPKVYILHLEYLYIVDYMTREKHYQPKLNRSLALQLSQNTSKTYDKYIPWYWH